jgi:Cu(I)/Ag(I) efflux system membrane fusion protein
MTATPSRPALAAAALALLLVGIAAGTWWARSTATPAATPAATATASPEKPLYWYDPMKPDQHFDKPGKSPFMDMELVPKYADAGAAGAGVRVDSNAQQSIGLRSALVTVGSLQPQIRVPATLTWDLRRESVVSARADAIVSRLQVRTPYQSVRRGQALASILAPAWSSALAEARALGQAQSPAARGLRGAAQQRLRVLGIPDGGVGADGSVVLRSPSDGVVSEVLVREGQQVLAGMPLFRINGTETLWLEAAIPQGSAGGVIAGTPVTATVSGLPGRSFAGEVETLLPLIDAGSRSQRARIVLHNDDGLLVPGMFAELSLQPAAGAAVALIPTEALVATGSDSRVIVLAADGSFLPVRVQVGRSAGGRTEILSGLKGGERIVTSGQFLIDSEANLSGALERLNAGAPAAHAGHAEDAAAKPAPAKDGQP